MTLEDYANWFEFHPELVIESYEVDEYNEVISIHFSHGETLTREEV